MLDATNQQNSFLAVVFDRAARSANNAIPHETRPISADPKTLIWLATKHSMLGNPLAGEVFEWSNVGARANNESESTNSNKAKFAGAAALGLLAGFLFS